MTKEKKRLGIFSFFSEPENLLQKKLEDHRTFSAIMFAMTALVGTSHWVWDYVTDPIGAQNTIFLRLLFLVLFAYSFAFLHVKSRRALEFASVIIGLLLLINYVEILNRLNTGMVYGIGGFVFFLFLPLLMFQGFSIRVSAISTFLFAAFPQILALLGVAHHFQHAQYAVLIWPAAIAMTLTHYAFAQNYRFRFDSETALEFASNTDPLTGVSNRRYFVPRIRHELIRSQRFEHPVSLIVLDIDNFKRINDVYGHSTGDAAICALANICRKMARQIDFVARLGGDEFAILLLEIGLEDAFVVGERIRVAVENTPIKSFEGMDVKFTVSIGVAQQPTGNMSEEWLIELADAAMYDAKTAGRNRVVSSTRGAHPITMTEI
ncbi:MAG: GGDEF domain-containing protein [Gammaproteobacteria bacterium]|nr:GGDEF domain-containing protein [Gammaproteobacteria bacterium]